MRDQELQETSTLSSPAPAPLVRPNWLQWPPDRANPGIQDRERDCADRSAGNAGGSKAEH
jgi:hypothetical protein